MNIDDILYILDLFPDAEVVVRPDKTLEIRRLGRLTTKVRGDGTMYLEELPFAASEQALAERVVHRAKC